jgi:hypothetical protein
MSHYVAIEYSDHTYNATVMDKGDLSFYLRNDKRHIVSIKPMDGRILPEWLLAEIKEAQPLNENVNFGELKKAISIARAAAGIEAKEQFPIAMSRGVEISAGDEYETQEMTTKKELLEFIEYAKQGGAKVIYVQGGFDGYDSVHDIKECIYEPWVSDWSIEIWNSESGIIPPAC